MNLTNQSLNALPLDHHDELVDLFVDRHLKYNSPRLHKLWDYYRNPMSNTTDRNVSGRQYQLAQEQGLPLRLRSPVQVCTEDRTRTRERVIENDIAWRIHTLVDFMFGRPFTLQSLAADRQRAEMIENFLRLVFDVNGGISFFQDLAMLGSVYGFVDVVLQVDNHSTTTQTNNLLELARRFTLKIVEPTRSVPVLNPHDYRVLDAYIIHYNQQTNESQPTNLFNRLRSRASSYVNNNKPNVLQCTELLTADRHMVFQTRKTYRNCRRKLVSNTPNPIRQLPVVHIQNLPQPFFYEGLSEVEPLIPLQDELNTRLSDRANRITLQSFKMYLGKGIQHFNDRPVGPGQMWTTDNTDAAVQEFGGDGQCPSEDAHINEIREAMDKTSSVTPVAAGMLRGKVGNLTSENALRIVLLGLLSKTERKRITYGRGIANICKLILHAADMLQWITNAPEERQIRLDWPDPLPQNQSELLKNAAVKLQVGVPARQVLTELGYADLDVTSQK